ncbi:HlyD family type I secretion periplasmic adaptor subunit [Polymorphum gilvum]|uniref:Membrane fusion protein (MFP) family protein n=1 Tax=Polymorphum gilvum (strain LMG 25793 / CGMCC 1.9160 / SL003B-26A1) TaxID=991905 RepID=F2J697_POLGS|nr:HlyD family type I secretion periplasmic adaptor subunit [Polymorphum gilvum]ADZ71271.1 Putative toxin/protease secretion system [Polymorphum gilvum SL003B-26A1]
MSLSPAVHDLDGRLGASIRRHLLAALALAAALVGGLGGWAAVTEIAGAVVATGTLVVETNVKAVQHQEGGIVRQIAVRDGDLVEAGDLLLRLDDTVTRANLAIVTRQLADLAAQEARLVAERDGRAEIVFGARPQGLQAADLAADLADVERSQVELLEARRASRTGRKKQLEEQIRQFDKQVEGLEAQRLAKGREIELIDDELADLIGLLDKKLVARNRVTALQRDKARLEGDYGSLIAQIAQSREAISERRLLILQIDDEARAEVLEQLQDVRGRLARLEEQRIAAEDQLARIDIRAPRAGYVHQLAVHTIGGVVGAGETVMLIVPREDLLVVEAKVQPVDIDQLAPGRDATVRFPSFDQRTTPELAARLVTVAADLTVDPATGAGYYAARLAIPDAELARLDGQTLVPGMPVEIFIRTRERTVLSYLVKPVADQIAHALRER